MDKVCSNLWYVNDDTRLNWSLLTHFQIVARAGIYLIMDLIHSLSFALA